MGEKYNLKHGHNGYERTRLYNTWLNMKQRCLNKNNPRYSNYGGKGVKICYEWLDDFTKFKDWAIGNGYRENLTIDRIDVDGDYEPANCRWISNNQQQNNKTNNRMIEYKGETKTLKEWAKHLGINYKTLQKRIYQGWGVETAFTLPLQTHRRGKMHETKSNSILK